MRVGAKLTGGFLIIVVSMWIIAAFSLKTSKDANKEFSRLNDNIILSGIIMTDLEKTAMYAEYCVMNYIIHDENEYRQNTLSVLAWLNDFGDKHLKLDDHFALPEQKVAGEIVEKIKELNSAISEIISLKDQGTGIEELLDVEKTNIRPILVALNIQLKAHRAVHMRELAEAKQAIHEMHSSNFQVILFLSLFITFMSIIVARYTAQSIITPLHSLYKGTELIGKGNLDYKIGTNAKDEIGQLSRAFDLMTEKLKATTILRDELAKEITERKKIEEILVQQNERLTSVNKITVDRELRMIELKKEINELLEESGRELQYKITEEKISEKIK